MNCDIRKKAILKAAGISIFAALFCIGCSDNDNAEEEVRIPAITTFVDIRDGKKYEKVQIGKQVWMAENLNYAADGSVCYDEGWSSIDPAKRCEEYGRLYDWNTAMNGESSSSSIPSGIEGVCPVGWHLPSDAEWTALTNFIGVDAGQQLKSVTFKGSLGAGHDGTDDFGFSALPGGYGYRVDGTNAVHGVHLGVTAAFWSATELDNDAAEARCHMLFNVSAGVTRSHMEKHYFASVRCVHD